MYWALTTTPASVKSIYPCWPLKGPSAVPQDNAYSCVEQTRLRYGSYIRSVMIVSESNHARVSDLITYCMNMPYSSQHRKPLHRITKKLYIHSLWKAGVPLSPKSALKRYQITSHMSALLPGTASRVVHSSRSYAGDVVT